MVGAGAIAGTLSGGYTNAARSPGGTGGAVDLGPAVVEQLASAEPAEYTPANTTTIAMTATAAARAAEAVPPPATVVAMRFPSQWQKEAPRASNSDNDPPPQTLAYAAEPQRPAAARASSGFQLASVDPNPQASTEPVPTPMPKRIAKPEKPKPAVLFNDAQLASIKARLRLTRDQEAYWPQVESALRAISWKIATQSRGIVGRNQAQMIDPNSPEVARLKSAAFPLIMSMREDQKQEVRQLAHTMGLKQVAAMF
jgi:hypothetical protein